MDNNVHGQVGRVHLAQSSYLMLSSINDYCYDAGGSGASSSAPVLGRAPCADQLLASYFEVRLMKWGTQHRMKLLKGLL